MSRVPYALGCRFGLRIAKFAPVFFTLEKVYHGDNQQRKSIRIFRGTGAIMEYDGGLGQALAEERRHSPFVKWGRWCMARVVGIIVWLPVLDWEP